MPLPFMLSFQPRLLLPSDDYRGPLRQVGFICFGIFIELLCFLVCFIWAVVCVHRNASRFAWAMVPFPLVIFDCIVILVALRQVVHCYDWLLPSERLLRLLLLWGLFCRVSLGVCFSMYVSGMVPLDALVFVSAGGYIISTILNLRRHSAYTWVKLQCWDLLILLQLLTFRLHASYPHDHVVKGVIWPLPTYRLVWPSVVEAMLYASFVVLMWMVVMRDEAIWRVAPVRTLSRLLLLQAFCTVLAVVSFSKWLSSYLDMQHTNRISTVEEGPLVDLEDTCSSLPQQDTAFWVVSGLVSFVLLLVLACFASICFIGRHAHLSIQEREDETLILSLQGTSSSSVTHPLRSNSFLVKDMQLTLERVSNHFYRIPADKRSQLPEGLNANVGRYQWPVPPHEADLEEGSEEGLLSTPHQSCLYGSCTDEPSIEGHLRPRAPVGSEAAVASAESHLKQPCTHSTGNVNTRATEKEQDKQKDSPRLSSTEEDPNALCIICFQNFSVAVFMHCGHGGVCLPCAVTCFRRNGVCPTCRTPLHGVLELEPRVDQTGQGGQEIPSEGASPPRYSATVRAVSF